MKTKTVDLGTQAVKVGGNALTVKLPHKWLVAHGLKLGDPLYSVLTIDGEIKVHLTQTEWSKKAKIRRVASRGSACVTLSAGSVRELGIEHGTIVRLDADIEHGVLTIRREL